jgi:pyrroloquinoline quinone biosynthesis protein B
LHTIAPDTQTTLAEGLSFVGTHVPHRGEYSDTLAFSFHGKQDSAFYCPDIDRWSDWERDIREVVEAHTLSFLDATFFDVNELPGRDLSTIPHPLVTDTVERLAHCEKTVVLIHLNHSNALYQAGTATQWVADNGLTVGATGQSWVLE